ncbi:hypothetical protein HYT57_02560 [Candidatus Woesearchaeota archaeon]|nr:hypothetical protein [Candidatus Woesearchaeota archaeon]
MYTLLERTRSFLREMYHNQEQTWDFFDTYQANLLSKGEHMDIWGHHVKSPLEEIFGEAELEDESERV